MGSDTRISTTELQMESSLVDSVSSPVLSPLHPPKKSFSLLIGLCRNDSCFSNSPMSKRFVLSFPPVSRNRLIPNPRSDSYFSHPLRFSFLVIFFSYPTSCWAEFAHGRFDPVYLQLCLITLINQQPSEIVSTFSYLHGT